MNDFDRLIAMLLAADAQQGDEGHPVKKPTSVFRIEMETGRGPFNSGRPDHEEIYAKIAAPKKGFNCAHLAGPDENHEQMGLTEEAFREAHGHAAYGCDSLESLQNWFPQPAREYLATKGAIAVEYEVPTGGYIMETGNGEVVFSKPDARRVRTLDVVALKEKVDA